MSFPVVEGQTHSASPGLATLHDVLIPAGVQAGDLLLLVFALDNGPVTITMSGWTSLNSTYNGTSRGINVYYKIATGSEVNFQYTTSAVRRSNNQCFRISGYDPTTVPAYAGATGNDANPNPPSLDPTAWDVEDTLWLIAISHQDALSTYPALYPDNRYTATGTISISYASRNLAAASDDPTTFTLTGSTNWAAATIAVRPAPEFTQQVVIY